MTKNQITQTVFHAAGIEVEPRPEPQPGGVAGAPGVAIRFLTPSTSIGSRELRLEPAVAKKLRDELMTRGRKDPWVGAVELIGGVNVRRVETDGRILFRFALPPNAVVFLDSALTSELIVALSVINS